MRIRWIFRIVSVALCVVVAMIADAQGHPDTATYFIGAAAGIAALSVVEAVLP